MVERHLLPPWPEIYLRIGECEPHRGRSRCPIHGGDSPTSLSVSEEKGVYFCHVCHASGDKVDFVRRVQGTDFKGALTFLGLEPGRAPKPDPIHRKAQAVRSNLRAWRKRMGREARDRLLARHELELCAIERLSSDGDDEMGWHMLALAFKGYDRDEHIADAVDLADEHDDQKLVAVYQEFKGAYEGI